MIGKDGKQLIPCHPAEAGEPLSDAAVISSTRWALWKQGTKTGPSVETSTVGGTKYPCEGLDMPKAHCLAATCVGDIESVFGWQNPGMQIKCTGRGNYQMTRLDQHGLPKDYLTRQRSVHTLTAGDSVIAKVPFDKTAGVYEGRMPVRTSGHFAIQIPLGVVDQEVCDRHSGSSSGPMVAGKAFRTWRSSPPSPMGSPLQKVKTNNE